MAYAAPEPVFSAPPFDYAKVRELMSGLEVSETLAVTLVRRGLETVAEAREFLEGSKPNDPLLLSDMEAACGAIEAAISQRRQVTVHGDYDVDGVCATTILVSALRTLGAEAGWVIPDRQDGYGLSRTTVEDLASRGTGLLVTVDCGIGSAAEITRAKELGMAAVVTDHHEPPEGLPDCPVVHPALGDYPFPGLCGTTVAWKLACALRARAGHPAERDEADLDLVALATVADMVPLRGENRTLVRRGLAVARRAGRPGLRALLAASVTDPATLDEGGLAFRLAPRINAAGRLYRADAGVELLLTSDEVRAEQIAAELDLANSERRSTEQVVLSEAEAAVRELAADGELPSALVVAGEGWHPGVVGIVASRLVEAHGRPAIVIALDEEGRGKGSGRSLPALDLVAALGACSEHLERFGGHKAAAGMEIRAAAVEAFRRAFTEHVARTLPPHAFRPAERIDAIVGGERLGMELAEELARLAPFGAGNPEVRLLIPAAELRDLRPMGEEGKHVRFAIATGSHRARGVGFGVGTSLGVQAGELCDVAVRLEANHWNGTVEPRAVLRAVRPLAGEAAQEQAQCATPDSGGSWWRRVVDEMERELEPQPDPLTGGERQVIEHAPGSAVPVVSGLVSSGTAVLAVVADSARRRALAERARPERFGAESPVVLCGHCSIEALSAVSWSGRGLVIADWPALRRQPGLAWLFQHVVLIDPPCDWAVAATLRTEAARDGPGFLHRCYGSHEAAFSGRVLEWEWAIRAPLRTLYTALRDSGGALHGDPLATALRGTGTHPRTAEQAGRLLRVLSEAGIGEVETEGEGLRAALCGEAGKVELGSSAAYLEYETRLQEGLRYLSEMT